MVGKIRESYKDNYCMISLTWGIKIVKLIELGNRMMFPRAQREEKKREIAIQLYKVSVMKK